MRRVAPAVFLMGLLLFSSSPPAAEAAKLLILPFELSSQESLDYLKDSLPDLLASRIGQSAEVTVVPPAKVKEALQGRQVLSLTDQEAQALARSAGADYLLFGRFTKIGETFSLDAALLDLNTGRLLGRFLADGEGTSQIIPKVGELAESVRKRFATFASPPPSPPAAGRFTPAPFTPAPSVTPAPSATRPPSPAPAPPQPTAVWTSRPLALEVRGIGVGDVNHDGTHDIVVLTKQEVHVYRWQGQDLQLLTRHSAGASLECLAVDVADLNGNGLAEIYVTALGPAHTVSSFVLEWSGSGLRPLVSNLPWYFRRVALADGPALLGQARGYEKGFEGPVRRFVWRGGQLVPGEPLSLPGHVTLYSFAMADLDGDGVPEVASVQSRSPLTVYGPRGAVLGRGAQYGQSALYVVEKASVNEDTEEGFHLPGRVLVANLPGHGTALLVSRNHESLGIFSRFKTFTNGEVIALRWSQEDLEEVWRTESFAYVADFQVASLPPQGEPVLIVATVTEFGGVFGSPRSRLVFVPLADVSR